MDYEDYFIPTVIVVAVVLLAAAVYLTLAQNKAWNKFAEEHQCKVIARKSGELLTLIDTNGKVTFGSTAEKVSYLCDDGITYTR